MDPRKYNVLANRYRREADQLKIGSPYRIKEYVDLRIKGKSREEAIRITKSKETQ